MSDYIIHFLLEVVGQGVLWTAYSHVCTKDWHKYTIWFIGTLMTSVVTVHLVG